MSEGLTIRRINRSLFMTKACKYLFVFAVLALLVATPRAFADGTSMYLSGAGDNAPYGVYVGPYYATVNGVANTPVICDDYSHDSYIGESWTANLSTSSNMSDVRFNPANYDELAYLANILFGLNGSNNAEADALQYAIWYLDDPTDVAAAIGGYGFFSDSTDVDGVAYWRNQAALNATPADLSDILIYTPTSGGNPQEFLVQTPEPGVILLLAIGLAGLFLLKRRQSSAVSLA
jgi:PEP-CTERM motif